MSVGRLYKIRRACGSRVCGSRVNYFNMDDYNSAASNVARVEKNFLDGEYSFIIRAKSADSLKAIKTILDKLWGWNGAPKPTSERMWNAAAHTHLYKFGGAGRNKDEHKANRDAAYKIAEIFATPDRISEKSTFGTDGYVKTSNGLTAYVDVINKEVDNPNDNPEDPDDDKLIKTEPDRSETRDGGNGGGGATYTGGGEGTGTGSSWTTWLLIGGGVLALVIVVALFLKKKK